MFNVYVHMNRMNIYVFLYQNLLLVYANITILPSPVLDTAFYGIKSSMILKKRNFCLSQKQTLVPMKSFFCLSKIVKRIVHVRNSVKSGEQTRGL
jgi:hypothetical protein